MHEAAHFILERALSARRRRGRSTQRAEHVGRYATLGVTAIYANALGAEELDIAAQMWKV